MDHFLIHKVFMAKIIGLQPQIILFKILYGHGWGLTYVTAIPLQIWHLHTYVSNNRQVQITYEHQYTEIGMKRVLSDTNWLNMEAYKY